jgi:glucose dehydrogenase
MKKALRVNTDFTTEVLIIDPDGYTPLRDAVGGLIQAVDLSPNMTMWCNEEGKLMGLTPSIIGTYMWEKTFGMTDIIVGNVVFTGGTDEDGETLGLEPKQLYKLKSLAAELRSMYEGAVTVVYE